jgi:hypothetical protein
VLPKVDDMGRREGRLVEHMVEVVREASWFTARTSHRSEDINRNRCSFRMKVRSTEIELKESVRYPEKDENSMISNLSP